MSHAAEHRSVRYRDLSWCVHRTAGLNERMESPASAHGNEEYVAFADRGSGGKSNQHSRQAAASGEATGLV